MLNIKICSIVRNRASTLPIWAEQIKRLNEYSKDQFSLSIYENDSTDGSDVILKNMAQSSFDSFACRVDLVSEKIDTPYLDALTKRDTEDNKRRVQNLAQARNKCMYGTDSIANCDYIIWIEADVTYNPVEIASLIEKAQDMNADILSVMSTFQGKRLYDYWATRLNSNEEWFSGGPNNKAIIPLWSTFNCVCLYKAEPIRRGITFDWYNKRLQKPDCDTAVICENFRANGYDKIFMDGSIWATHQ